MVLLPRMEVTVIKSLPGLFERHTDRIEGACSSRYSVKDATSAAYFSSAGSGSRAGAAPRSHVCFAACGCMVRSTRRVIAISEIGDHDPRQLEITVSGIRTDRPAASSNSSSGSSGGDAKHLSVIQLRRTA